MQNFSLHLLQRRIRPQAAVLPAQFALQAKPDRYCSMAKHTRTRPTNCGSSPARRKNAAASGRSHRSFSSCEPLAQATKTNNRPATGLGLSGSLVRLPGDRSRATGNSTTSTLSVRSRSGHSSTRNSANKLVATGKMPQRTPWTGRGHCYGLDRTRRRNVILRPQLDVAVVVAFDLSPSCEGQQRLVVTVADEHVFNPY